MYWVPTLPPLSRADLDDEVALDIRIRIIRQEFENIPVVAQDRLRSKIWQSRRKVLGNEFDMQFGTFD